MALIDPVRKRLDVKVVLWGPSRGGKTTTLRSLHGAFDPADRGTLAFVDTQDERTYFFDYAPLDAPRWHGLDVRVHAYTVPGQESYVETRRRILRGADAVIFVADASPGAERRTLASWRQLDDALRLTEGTGVALPIVVGANKQDVVGAAFAPAVARALLVAVPGRVPRVVHGTCAVTGRGVARCFHDALLAALQGEAAAEHESADESGGESAVTESEAFTAAWAARLCGGADGIRIEDAPKRRGVSVPISSRDPDAGGLEAALAAVEWAREGDEALAALTVAVGAPRAASGADGGDAVAARVRGRAGDEAWDALARLREGLQRLDQATTEAGRAEALGDARRAAGRVVEALSSA